MTAQEATNARAWLSELIERRQALKRQLFNADASSATVSAGSGSRSYTNRSVDDIKKKIAAVEAEIVSVCGDLGEPVPFTTTGGIRRILARF